MSLAGAFERVYVINLPHRTDRRREMEADLRRVGVDPASVRFFPARRPEDAGPFDSIGVRGAFLSHRDVLAEAAADGVETVLVLEDDATFPADLPAKLEGVMAALATTDWTLCLLGHLQPKADGPIERLDPGRSLILAHANAWRGNATIGELVAFLDELLSRPAGDPAGGPMPVDGAFNVFRSRRPELACYFAQPSLAGQRASRSDITVRAIDRVPIVRELVTLARKLRRAIVGGR